MGKRSRGKLEIRAVGAFTRQQTWNAMALADACEVELGQLVEVVSRLQQWGLPISHGTQEDATYGSEVQYSVSKAWFDLWRRVGGGRPESLAPHKPGEGNGGGETQNTEELEFLLEALLAMPSGKPRDRLVRRALEGQFASVGSEVPELCSGLTDCANDSLQRLLLTAASARVPVRARLLDKRGRLANARLTVHRVVPSPDGVVATEHATGQLDWYPYQSIVSATLLRGEKVRRVERDELESFMDNLLSHASERESLQFGFTVRYPESEWVRHHLPPGMWVDEQQSDVEQLRVVVRDNAPLAARLVASLGGAAKAEGPVLTGLVTGIAVGTLSAHRDCQPPQRRDDVPRRSTFRPLHAANIAGNVAEQGAPRLAKAQHEDSRALGQAGRSKR